MRPNQLVKELSKKGIKISADTVRNWEKANVISKAVRQNFGGTIGSVTSYPKKTLYECVTVFYLRNYPKLSLREIEKARDIYNRVSTPVDKLELKNAILWRTYHMKAEKNEPDLQEYAEFTNTYNSEITKFFEERVTYSEELPKD